MCLVGLMVGVLSHNDDLDVGDGSSFEGIEDIFFSGIDLIQVRITFLPDSY